MVTEFRIWTPSRQLVREGVLGAEAKTQPAMLEVLAAKLAPQFFTHRPV